MSRITKTKNGTKVVVIRELSDDVVLVRAVARSGTFVTSMLICDLIN